MARFAGRAEAAPRATRLAVAGLVAAALLAHDRAAHAQVEWGDARRYSARSVSVLGTPELSLTPAFTARLTFDVTARINVAGGFTVQPRAGIGAGGSVPGGGATTVTRFGVGAGATFAVHASVAMSPMLAYDVFVLAGVGTVVAPLVHRATVELPVSVLLGRHALAELYLQAGVGVVYGALDLAIGGGLRFGVTFPWGADAATTAAATTAPAAARAARR